MAIWNAWFREKPYQLPSLQLGMFGRYTDSYKSALQRKSWAEATKAFDKNDFMGQMESFLQYLSDPRQESVHWTREGERFRFEIIQGSRILMGVADAHVIRVEATIGLVKTPSVSLFRRLMEQNYLFEYCRYALSEEQHLMLVFTSYSNDCPPYKLYQALKELALHADKQDDLLFGEFDIIEAVQNAPRESWSGLHCEVRYEYLHQQVATLVDQIQSGGLDPAQNQGAISYLIMATIYRLDYLIKSEGYLMDAIEQMRNLYFDQKAEKTQESINRELLSRLIALTERPFELYKNEFYQVRHTFGLTAAESHDRFVGFVDGELQHMHWYLGRGLEQVAQAIPDYIVGHCLFNYALPQPLRDLLHLYYEINEQDYFNRLGFEYATYRSVKNGFDEQKIRNAILGIIEIYKGDYPKLSVEKPKLEFKKRMAAFAGSYLMFLRQLDFNK